MAIPEIIEQLAHKVRTEIYGRDVREALATSMEVTAEVAEWSREVAQQIIDGSFDEGALNTEIERKLNELEQQYAPKLTSLESEIVDARGTEANLSGRLNDLDSQLSLKAQQSDLNETKRVIGASRKMSNNFPLESHRIITYCDGNPITVYRGNISNVTPYSLDFETDQETTPLAPALISL